MKVKLQELLPAGSKEKADSPVPFWKELYSNILFQKKSGTGCRKNALHQWSASSLATRCFDHWYWSYSPWIQGKRNSRIIDERKERLLLERRPDVTYSQIHVLKSNAVAFKIYSGLGYSLLMEKASTHPEIVLQWLPCDKNLVMEKYFQHIPEAFWFCYALFTTDWM